MALKPYKVDDFISNKFKEYLKVYLVFRFKEYSWKKELQNSFSIADSIVNESLKLLEKEGYLISKDFWSLDIDMQDSIKKLNGAYFQKINSSPKIYVLNKDEIHEEWWNVNKEEIEELIKKNGSMEHTLNLINISRKHFEKLQKKNDFLENSQFERERIDWETGIKYYTKTKKSILFEKELKKFSLEFKKELLLKKGDYKQISKEEKKQLLKINKNNEDLVLFEKEKLTKNKLELVFNGLSLDKNEFNKKLKDKEIKNKLVEKELKKDLKVKKAVLEVLKNNEKLENPCLNPPQIKGFGKSISEIDNNLIENLTKWDNFFGINEEKDYTFSNLNEKKKAERIVKILINELTKEKKLSILFAQRTSGSKNIFDFFLYKIKDLELDYDGDFLYLK